MQTRNNHFLVLVLTTWIFKPTSVAPTWHPHPVPQAAMGYASYLVYEQGGFEKQATPLAIYIVQLALNFIWTP